MAEDGALEAENEMSLEAPAEEKKEEGGGAPGWMATFADLVTLLICFFVLLFAMSTTHPVIEGHDLFVCQCANKLVGKLKSIMVRCRAIDRPIGQEDFHSQVGAIFFEPGHKIHPRRKTGLDLGQVIWDQITSVTLRTKANELFISH